jgi:hypothetical protein
MPEPSKDSPTLYTVLVGGVTVIDTSFVGVTSGTESFLHPAMDKSPTTLASRIKAASTNFFMDFIFQILLKKYLYPAFAGTVHNNFRTSQPAFLCQK